MKHRKKNELGYSLVEILVSLTIIMIVSTMAISINSMRVRDQKISVFISGHQELANTIHSIGSNTPNYFIDWYGTINSSVGWPRSIRYGTGSPPTRHDFDGTVTITGQEQFGPTNGDTFPGIALAVVSYASLPRDVCNRFVNTVAPQSFDTYVNGTRVRLVQPTLSETDITQVSSLCTNTSNNLVQIATMRPFSKGLLPSDSSTTTAFQTTLMGKYATLNTQRNAMHP